MLVCDLVQAVEELCAGPLAGRAATRLALRKALLRLLVDANKVMEVHREAWGLTGSKEDKEVGSRWNPYPFPLPPTNHCQAVRAYAREVAAARAALRVGGQLATTSYALPRLEPGDRCFARMHQALGAFTAVCEDRLADALSADEWAEWRPKLGVAQG